MKQIYERSPMRKRRDHIKAEVLVKKCVLKSMRGGIGIWHMGGLNTVKKHGFLHIQSIIAIPSSSIFSFFLHQRSFIISGASRRTARTPENFPAQHKWPICGWLWGLEAWKPTNCVTIKPDHILMVADGARAKWEEDPLDQRPLIRSMV